jgi:hypothetical protein
MPGAVACVIEPGTIAGVRRVDAVKLMIELGIYLANNTSRDIAADDLSRMIRGSSS